MLYWCVFIGCISRLPAVPSSRRRPVLPPLSPKSFTVNSFADPHPLNLYTAIFYKNVGGQGVFPTAKTFKCFNVFSDLSPVLSNSCALFCAFLHFFVFSKNSTYLFSSSSALFAQKQRVWGRDMTLTSRAEGIPSLDRGEEAAVGRDVPV